MSLTRRSFLASTFASSSLALVTAPVWAKAPAFGHQVLSAYRHKVGNFEVIALSDGAVDLPLAVFPKADPAEAGNALEAVGGARDKVTTQVNAFLVNTGDKLVLIDSGAGQFFGPTLGRFAAGLAALGVEPASIDVIAMTHLHPDHFGGLLTGDAKVAFPNATIFVSEPDMKLWLDEANAAQAAKDFKPFFDQARMVMGPYVSQQRYRPLGNGQEVVSGVTAIAAPGHTPGHTMFAIASGKDSLLVWGDIIHAQALQFAHPEWAVAFDTDSDLAIATRRKVFDMAAADRLTIAGAHVPFPGIGHVARAGNTYAYLPLFWMPD
jgi:glyoxylase-like metal-dependent hydrolase (beta-lactamase superfamily II)